MFNSNIPATALLGIESSNLGAHTPKTPEILNSLIAMTNPMDGFSFGNSNSNTATTPVVTVRNFNGNNANAQSHSQDSSHSSCSASPLDSPAGTATMPSVQQTCSQLIKAGLKLSIQSKRKTSTCDSSSGSEQPNSKCSRRDEDCEESSDDDSETKGSTPKGLTPEDEDRRRRRRERNKIAATKCRMKKRERTQNLIKESEVLDTQNVELKNQVRSLETERRKLLDMLQGHAPSCVRRGGCQLPSKLLQSPAHKYLAELELESSSSAGSGIGHIEAVSNTNAVVCNGNGAVNGANSQRMSIPSMSTFKTTAAMAAVAAAAQLQQVPGVLPNGYCKPSPSPQEFEHAGYLSSPTQEALCLPVVLHQQQQQQQQQQQLTPTNNNNNSSSNNSNNNNASNGNCQSSSNGVQQQVSDYVPNCEGLSLGLALSAVTVIAPTSNNNNNNSSSTQQPQLSSVTTSTATTPTNGLTLSQQQHRNHNELNELASPLGCLQHVSSLSASATTPTTAIEFVKNELVDSQSPYTTEISPDRFLFESSDSFCPDIKHAVSVHPSSINNMTSVASLATHNYVLDFHRSAPCNGGVAMSSAYDEDDMLLMKNNYLNGDLLAQLTEDGADFVDLDTGNAAFMTNGGCLA